MLYYWLCKLFSAQYLSDVFFYHVGLKYHKITIKLLQIVDLFDRVAAVRSSQFMFYLSYPVF